MTENNEDYVEETGTELEPGQVEESSQRDTYAYGSPDDFESREDFERQESIKKYYVSYKKGAINNHLSHHNNGLELFEEQCERKCRRYEGTVTLAWVELQSIFRIPLGISKKVIQEPYIDIESRAEHAFLDNLPMNLRFRHNLGLKFFNCPISGEHHVWEGATFHGEKPTYDKCNCIEEMSVNEIYEHFCDRAAVCRYHYLLKRYMEKVWTFPLEDPPDQTESR